MGLGIVHHSQDAGKMQDLDLLFLKSFLHQVPISTRRRVRLNLDVRKSPPHQLGPDSRGFLEDLNGATNTRLGQQDDGEDIQVGQKLLNQIRVAPEIFSYIVLVSRRHFLEQALKSLS